MPFMVLVRKTLHSITQARLISLMLLCAALGFLLVLALVAGITWLTADMVSLERQWLDTTINWLVGIATGIGGWFMLPVLVVIIAGVFQEITIHRVEQAEYPDEMRSEEPHFWADILHDVRFTIKALTLNLLVLPLYFFGIGFVLSVLLNSYLLGREFFESAAGYHLGKPQARELGRRHRRMVYGSGFVFTLLTLTPIVNLISPIIAIVWMVHVYHGMDKQMG